MEADRRVFILGAGMAGPCAAKQLHQAGVSFQLLEASNSVGGRNRLVAGSLEELG